MKSLRSSRACDPRRAAQGRTHGRAIPADGAAVGHWLLAMAPARAASAVPRAHARRRPGRAVGICLRQLAEQPRCDRSREPRGLPASGSTIAAMCPDYRASFRIDLQRDRADRDWGDGSTHPPWSSPWRRRPSSPMPPTCGAGGPRISPRRPCPAVTSSRRSRPGSSPRCSPYSPITGLTTPKPGAHGWRASRLCTRAMRSRDSRGQYENYQTSGGLNGGLR
jgi:hypothetical protein